MPYSVTVHAYGPPDSFTLEDSPRAPLKPGQLRVGIKAAGISYVDVLTATGGYQVKPPLPFVPGSEAAGVVIETGAGVTRFAPGDRVVCTGWGGLFAQEAVLSEAQLALLPDGLSFEDAAVFPVAYATAWHALIDRGQIKPGETLLVLGAAGATGYAAVQLGAHLGAKVIASASSPEKRALALAAGAHAAVDARAEDWRDQVKAANDGAPVDLVFDPVGGAATDPAFRSLGWGGRHLVIGFLGGIAALKTNLPLLKGASMVGVDLRQFGERQPDQAAANRAAAFELAAQGILRPAIAQRFALADFAQAMNAAASGALAGRVVLVND